MDRKIVRVVYGPKKGAVDHVVDVDRAVHRGSAHHLHLGADLNLRNLQEQSESWVKF